jgi:hypothetical protein
MMMDGEGFADQGKGKGKGKGNSGRGRWQEPLGSINLAAHQALQQALKQASCTRLNVRNLQLERAAPKRAFLLII